ncbi:MAG: 3-dehydroquinate synthase [Flavobacteriales bacterium]
MSPILFKEQGWSFLNELLETERAVILHDSNTKVCLEHLHVSASATRSLPTIEIPAGEENKKLNTCEKVWYELTELGADRKTILLNLGGGVVTDLGGFVAGTYMRGIRFVNIPTSMLGMADASIGGKTGVDFGVLKNMIGTFAQPEAVVIDSTFLKTLPSRHYSNGLAEVIKHAFLTDSSIPDLMYANEDELISGSVNAKVNVVKADEFEAGERKKLNFGHTIGHAIESHFLNSGTLVLHGEAIGAGMILEAHISMKSVGLSTEAYASVYGLIDSIFSRLLLTEEDWNSIKALLVHDKKNAAGALRFVLLSKLGEAVVDQGVSEELLDEAFAAYAKKK